jgi:hypothetical protein
MRISQEKGFITLINALSFHGQEPLFETNVSREGWRGA